MTSTDSVIFKRGKAVLIISIFSSLLLIGLTILIFWGAEFRRPEIGIPTALFIVFLIYSIIAVFTLILSLLSPKQIIFTNDKKVVIGKIIYDADDVKISTHTAEYKADKIILWILLGILPGTLIFLSLGLNKVIFTCGQKKYILRYIGNDILYKQCRDGKLLSTLVVGPTKSDEEMHT